VTGNPTDSLSPLESEIVSHVFLAIPSRAVSLGLHEYDGVVPDVSATGTKSWSATARKLLGRLGEVADSSLTPARRYDRTLLRLRLDGLLFDFEERREYDVNPMEVLTEPTFTSYMVRDYAPVSDRVTSIVRILNAVPTLLESAKARLERNLPRPFVTLAIQIGSGLPSHFEEAEAFARPCSPSLREEVHAGRELAASAVRSFVEWLRNERLPYVNDSFALGREMFQRLLWVREGLTISVDELLRRGLADLKRNQDRLAAISRTEGVSADHLIARLNDSHPSPEQLLPLVRSITDDTREFIRKTDFVTVPEPQVCHVRETPPWAHDLWSAAMDSPGPFDKAVDGIYWITAVDPAWTPAQKEEWMRTLNHSMLKNTTIHEVWPGHYLQRLHVRKTEQSLARKLWSSYAFAEGWAHYCEQAALESGFGAGSTDAEVTQLHDALLRNCRLVASIGMHTQGMSVADATKLLRTEAHLEELNAQREAIRGTYDPQYFSYTLGKIEILNMRSKYLASRFRSSLKEFHDTLLSFGTPPVGCLDSLMAGS
jgi:Bacterial protein of unknown function (DUF885)